MLNPLYLNTMKLKTILESMQVAQVSGSVGMDIAGVTHDSRKVRENYLFAALPGQLHNGTDFVGDAIERGAIAVLHEDRVDLPARVTGIQASDARRALAEAACALYEFPSQELQMIGVTGTNGKTTTAFCIREFMAAAGRTPGMLGTVRYEIGKRVIPASRTTPESPDLQAMLRQMLTAGCRSAVMEVSSHALEQQRVRGIDYDVGVFTNLTREHLDYHGTMPTYFSAKAKLFDGLGQQQKKAVAVVNIDDEWGRQLLECRTARVQQVTYSGQGAADVRAEQIQLYEDRSTFALKTPWGDAPIDMPLIGRFNVSNVLAACAACGSLGVDPGLMAQVLRGMSQVPGRVEAIHNELGIRVFVDYAHTADALENVMRALREFATGRLIVVFGCGGDRDREKRPAMGRVAAYYADRSIITTDNARSEDPADIAVEVMAGFEADARVEIVLDRQEAIAHALASALPGDTVLIAGKGHENYQEIKHVIQPFDDREVVRAVLRSVEDNR